MIVCDKCKNKFNDYSITECKHPAVNKKIGRYMCICCCIPCKHFKHEGLGYKCIYPKEK